MIKLFIGMSLPEVFRVEIGLPLPLTLFGLIIRFIIDSENVFIDLVRFNVNLIILV